MSVNFWGRVNGSLFIVDKLPKHVFIAYDGFGIDEIRLKSMLMQGVDRALILFHETNEITRAFKVSLKKWLLEGHLLLVKDGRPQRVIEMRHCEEV